MIIPKLSRQTQSTLYLICISFQRGHHDQIAKLAEVKCFFLQRTLKVSEKMNENCFFIGSLSNMEVSFSNKEVYSLFGVAVGGVHLYLGDNTDNIDIKYESWHQIHNN